MIDVERLAKAHFEVQRQNAFLTRRAIVDRGDPPGAHGMWLIRTEWDDLDEPLKDARRAIAKSLVDAYEWLGENA